MVPFSWLFVLGDVEGHLFAGRPGVTYWNRSCREDLIFFDDACSESRLAFLLIGGGPIGFSFRFTFIYSVGVRLLSLQFGVCYDNGTYEKFLQLGFLYFMGIFS